MYALNFDPAICESCDTCDCLMRCQYMTFDLEEAKREKANINNGKESWRSAVPPVRSCWGML